MTTVLRTNVQYQKIFSNLHGLQALQMNLLNSLQAMLNLHPVSLWSLELAYVWIVEWIWGAKTINLKSWGGMAPLAPWVPPPMMLFAIPTNTSASVCCSVMKRMNLPCSFWLLHTSIGLCWNANHAMEWLHDWNYWRNWLICMRLHKQSWIACSICGLHKTKGTEHGFGQPLILMSWRNSWWFN